MLSILFDKSPKSSAPKPFTTKLPLMVVSPLSVVLLTVNTSVTSSAMQYNGPLLLVKSPVKSMYH